MKEACNNEGVDSRLQERGEFSSKEQQVNGYREQILDIYPYEDAAPLSTISENSGLTSNQLQRIFFLAGRAVERKGPLAFAFVNSAYDEDFVIPLDGHSPTSTWAQHKTKSSLFSSLVLPQFSCGSGSSSVNHKDCYVDLESSWVAWSIEHPVCTSKLNFQALEIWQTISSCDREIISIIDRMRRPPTLAVVG
jgi:hypothetical protein